MDGVLGFGMPLAAAVMAIVCPTHGWQIVVRTLPVGLIIFAIGGVGWGLRMWPIMEKRYAETAGREPDC